MEKSTLVLSIVSPVFQAELIVDELVRRLLAELSQITESFEIVLVDDGSLDGSWRKIEENCSKHSQVKGVKLSRNFGQHYAVTAGIDHACGEHIIILDCDLQDDPANIRTLYNTAKDGRFDIVFTKRLKKQHSLLKKIGSSLYNLLLQMVSYKQYTIDMGSMVLFNNKVKNALRSLKEQERLYIQLLKWVGFSSTFIHVEHKKRFAGRSTYSIARMISLGFNGITAHSNKLLHLSVSIGFVLALASMLGIIVIVWMYFQQGFQSGWASLICAILFSTGLILMSVGVVGLYIGKIYSQVKERPLYIVDKIINE